MDDNEAELLLAAARGDREQVAQLLDAQADIECTDSDENHKRKPLHHAAYHGHHDVVALLLDRNADIAALNGRQSTSMHLAAFRGHDSTVRLLLDRGASSNVANMFSMTPIQNATASGHLQVVKTLIDHRAQPNHVTDLNTLNSNLQIDHLTTLHWAARTRQDARMFELLLASKANVNARDSQSHTPLHYMASFAHHDNQPALSITQLLVTNRALVDATNMHNETPLLFAVYNNHASSIVRYLLERGADLHRKSSVCRRGVELASARDHELTRAWCIIENQR
jgi:ankyrin repeat protein